MTNKSDFSKARVGDRVWSPFGPECAEGETNGEIVKLDATWDGFTVETDDLVRRHFWRNGFYCRNDSFPSLFWARPKIEIPPPPKRMKQVIVEVRPYRERMTGSYNMTSNSEDYPSFRQLWCGPIQTIEVEVDDE